MPDAVIYVPLEGSAAQRQRWRDICAAHCIRRRYRIVAVVSVWQDVENLVVAGKASVKVAALPEHFPPDREPRDEGASEGRFEPLKTPAPRRARRLGRTPEGP